MAMDKRQIRSRIEEIGIIPAVRIASAEGARFAAEAVATGGIPIVELTMTVPGALDIIAELVRSSPDVIVGAGTILDLETARACADAGAQFLTSPGLELELVEFAHKQDLLVFPGALTPTEVLAAWKAGADLVKVYPCAEVGGDRYIRALKGPFPQVPLIAAGGVTQRTAAHFIAAGATAVGIGRDLIPPEAIRLRQADWIHELAHRFSKIVQNTRSQMDGH